MPEEATRKKDDKPSRRLETTKSPAYVRTYANNVTMQASTWDFHFDFGEIMDSSPETLNVEVRATVVMSPQHSKAFLRILHEHIGKYEQQFGEIKIDV